MICRAGNRTHDLPHTRRTPDALTSRPQRRFKIMCRFYRVGANNSIVIKPSNLIEACSYTATILNSLPNDNILDWPKFKAFADYKLKMVQIIKFLFDGVENVIEKSENNGYQHLILFRQCFQKFSCSGSLKVKTECLFPRVSQLIIVLFPNGSECRTVWKTRLRSPKVCKGMKIVSAQRQCFPL